MEDKREILRETAKDMLPDTVIALGFMEHQLDLIGQLVVDLLEIVDTTAEIDPAVRTRVDMLKGLLNYSSIDFNNLASPFQSYKIPKATEVKGITRQVQLRYLEAQQREGLLGD